MIPRPTFGLWVSLRWKWRRKSPRKRIVELCLFAWSLLKRCFVRYANVHPMRAIFLIPSRDPPTLADPASWSAELRNFVHQCLTKV